MRTISISTDVFAAIWADRVPGEDSEDDILRRKFGLKRSPKTERPVADSQKIGFVDPRYNLKLPEGFEIFRTYLGKEYRAQAINGAWKLLNTGQSYPSINQLSRAIGAKIENAWQNWYFRGPDGQRQLISSLR